MAPRKIAARLTPPSGANLLRLIKTNGSKASAAKLKRNARKEDTGYDATASFTMTKVLPQIRVTRSSARSARGVREVACREASTVGEQSVVKTLTPRQTVIFGYNLTPHGLYQRVRFQLG